MIELIRQIIDAKGHLPVAARTSTALPWIDSYHGVTLIL